MADKKKKELTPAEYQAKRYQDRAEARA